MSHFEIYSGITLIGYSELEAGDPPMGVAFGKFIALAAYSTIKAAVISSNEQSQQHLHLSAKLTNGITLPAQGGVQITDFSAEFGSDGVQVFILGIGYPLYQELFPAHVKAYETQF